MPALSPIAAAPAPAAAHPQDAALTWVCSFCGLVRAFEGGRLACGPRNECRECGARLADRPEHARPIATALDACALF